MILQSDIDSAHQLRAWADAGTLLDFFTETESLQVRITRLDIIERAGAQFIQYEVDVVEASPNPIGPQPVQVQAGPGGLLVISGAMATVQASPTPFGGTNPLGLAPVVRTGLSGSANAGTGGFVNPLALGPVSPVETPSATVGPDIADISFIVTGEPGFTITTTLTVTIT